MTIVHPAQSPVQSSFDSLGLSDKVIAALAKIEITTPTPVQAAVIPDAMAGHDLLGRAQTGSGKTLAFGLPILARLAGDRSRPKHPRALIVVPTRELATQVRRSLEPLAFAVNLKLTTVYGGTPYDKQIKALRNGADIVVATPGRLEDLVDRGACRLDDIAITVLDEADHLCDLGFYPVVDKLMRETPQGSQRMLLSATLDGDVDRLVRTHLRAPRLHQLNASTASITTMDHHVLVVGGFRDKVTATTALVEANPRSIVFTRTREGATELADSLTAGGIEAVDLHGNLSQRVRERNLHKFSSGKAQVVVATDVAARGIHVDHVGLVIHYDVPADAKAYLHRSGRTARAGESGAVVTIATPRQLDEVVRLQSRAGVETRHHDIRTAPRPMTAEALAESGVRTPTVRRAGSSGRGDNRVSGRGASRGDSRGRGGYQGNREKPAPSRPDRTERSGSRPGQRDPRSTSADRRTSPERRPDFRERGFVADRATGSDRGQRSERPQRSDRPDDRSDRAQRSDRPNHDGGRPRPSGRAGGNLDRDDFKKKPRWSQTNR